MPRAITVYELELNEVQSKRPEGYAFLGAFLRFQGYIFEFRIYKLINMRGKIRFRLIILNQKAFHDTCITKHSMASTRFWVLFYIDLALKKALILCYGPLGLIIY